MPFALPEPGQGVRQPADPARGRRRRLRRGHAGAAGSQPAPRRRRPHRPARRQRQRQEHLRQADRRPAGAAWHGRRYGSDKIAVGYFAQHQMDELPAAKTPYQHMLDLMPEATEAQRRARLGALGFGADKADTKAENLSGGEKARLLFALATFGGRHLLILDEPTNHLDVDAREALVRALNDYEGAVILISHDRHLIEACADRLWIVRDGTRAHLRRRHGPVSRRVPRPSAAARMAPRAKVQVGRRIQADAAGRAPPGGRAARGACAPQEDRDEGRGRDRAPEQEDRQHRERARRRHALRRRCRPRPGAGPRARRTDPRPRRRRSRLARSQRSLRGGSSIKDEAV